MPPCHTVTKAILRKPSAEPSSKRVVTAGVVTYAGAVKLGEYHLHLQYLSQMEPYIRFVNAESQPNARSRSTTQGKGLSVGMCATSRSLAALWCAEIPGSVALTHVLNPQIFAGSVPVSSNHSTKLLVMWCAYTVYLLLARRSRFAAHSENVEEAWSPGTTGLFDSNRSWQRLRHKKLTPKWKRNVAESFFYNAYAIQIGQRNLNFDIS